MDAVKNVSSLLVTMQVLKSTNVASLGSGVPLVPSLTLLIRSPRVLSMILTGW